MFGRNKREERAAMARAQAYQTPDPELEELEELERLEAEEARAAGGEGQPAAAFGGPPITEDDLELEELRKLEDGSDTR